MAACDALRWGARWAHQHDNQQLGSLGMAICTDVGVCATCTGQHDNAVEDVTKGG
jgi:hypothetical protein